MPSLSHSPLASYNPKNTYENETFCTFVHFAHFGLFCELFAKKADLVQTFSLLKMSGPGRPFLRYFKIANLE